MGCIYYNSRQTIKGSYVYRYTGIDIVIDGGMDHTFPWDRIEHR